MDDFSNFGVKKFINHIVLIESDGHLWTIAVEFKFYFILPVLCYLLTATKDNLALSALCVSAFSIFALGLKYFCDLQLGLYFHIFMCGSFAAILVNAFPNGPEVLTRRRSNIILMASGILISAMLPHVFLNFSGILIDVQCPLVSAIYGVLWAVILLNLVWHDNFLTTLLSSRAFRYFGVISFSGYIWHVVLIDLLVDVSFINGSVKLLLLLVATLAVSHVSYLLLEKPFLASTGDMRK